MSVNFCDKIRPLLGVKTKIPNQPDFLSNLPHLENFWDQGNSQKASYFIWDSPSRAAASSFRKINSGNRPSETDTKALNKGVVLAAQPTQNVAKL